MGESFAMPWLRLDQLTGAKPDPGIYRDFCGGPQGKVTLHSAMLLEALLLFETVLGEDRSILNFLSKIKRKRARHRAAHRDCREDSCDPRLDGKRDQ